MRLCILYSFSIVLLVATSFVSPYPTYAQSPGNLTGEDSPFTIGVSPQYPAPYSQATLSLFSSSLSLANATMTVLVDGENIYKGAARSLSIPIGKGGSLTRVSVTISSEGSTYNKTLSVQPQDVSLIAEPISSSPVLYLGKSFVPVEGDVRVVAVANLRNSSGVPVDPSSLSYSWTVDGVKITEASGVGKKAVVVASPLQYRARDISVVVTNSGGTLIGGSSLALSASDPFVRIYENDPLMGIRFDRAISNNYTLRGAEESLFAAPFSLPATHGTLFMQWFLNGAKAQAGNSITLRPAGSGEGRASLSLTASVGSYTKAVASIYLIFGKKESHNDLFGL